MLINENELKKYVKRLESVPFAPVAKSSATFFFGIDTGKTVDDGQFVMEVKDKKETGSAASVKPGLVLLKEEDAKGRLYTKVVLAYADINYSPKFNLDAYLDFVEAKINKKDRALLTELDAYLVKPEYIFAEFEI